MKETEKSLITFELRPIKNDPRAVGIVLLKNLILIGRSSNCDLTINYPQISNIHAVVEVSSGKGLVYDMNSTNGIKINGEKVEGSAYFKLGDKITFADIEYEFMQYAEPEKGKFKLDILDPQKANILFPEKTKIFKNPFATKKPSEEGGEEFLYADADSDLDLPPVPRSLEEQVKEAKFKEDLKVKKPKEPTYVSYPLGKDPKADFNEYIFEEDLETSYPVFNYEPEKQTVEVIILYKDNLLSVDYLPSRSGDYHLVKNLQESKGAEDVELPAVGDAGKWSFVHIDESKKVFVSPLPGFSVLFLQDHEAQEIDSKAKDEKDINSKMELNESGVIRFYKDELQIFVRKVSAPPEVKAPPFVRRDPELKKYTRPAMIAALVIILILIFVKFEKEDEVVKTVENIKRIARIVKKSKTQEAKVKRQVVQKRQNNQAPSQKTAKQRPTKKAVVSQKVKKFSKTSVKKKATKNKKTKTRIKAFKPPVDFSSKLKNLLNKGSKVAKVKVDTPSSDFNLKDSQVVVGSGSSDKIKRAEVNQKVGSFEGVASGNLDKSTSASGLAVKGATTVAAIPEKTVVLGSMDPSIILKILRDAQPQFTYCHQREIDKNKSKFEGVVKLEFTIGVKGAVTKAQAVNPKGPASFRKCIRGTLLGLKFPRPKGGGSVEVSMPLNFSLQNLLR